MIPPMPEGFTDRAAWDAIHFPLRCDTNGNFTVLTDLVVKWQKDNQERVQAALKAANLVGE